MTINKEVVAGLVQEALEGRDDLFVTEVKVKPDQTIYVFMDGDNGVKRLDRDKCDFELNVSSFGIGRPLQLLRQYRNAVGKTLSVKMTDDTKVRGKLTAVDERQLTLELPAVRKQPATVRTIAMSDIREAKVEVTF